MKITKALKSATLCSWSIVYHIAHHPTQSGTFRRQPSQPITWLILTNKTLQGNTQTKSTIQKVNNAKYSKTKIHSARKREGVILRRSQAHTEQMW